MSNATPPADGADRGTQASGSEPVGELVQRASQQLTELVRGELRLAQAEMKQKGKRFGKGGGLFGGTGVVGFLTLQALVATAIAGLAALPVWAAALIITAVLGVITAVLAMTGRKEVSQTSPPAPEQTIESVKEDVAEIKESAQR
ncbi:phage holin family protein [Streptomyces mirabilis]|uniref:phage holin family protein n=1 Tax=Streptomyces mirabilis TaxID=68239 RepID=UPI00331D82D1